MSKHSIEKTRRQYNTLVATENLEDYALRYSPSKFRKWSSLLVANTALGSISFLALEAIGAVLFLDFGFTNAVWAISLASVIILLAGLPISYYAARYNIDIDLLTRSAGFGYVGSTITSLIYASFCFIFFALEAAIMAQALFLYYALPLYLGYILCSLIIIPIVFHGITAINRLHRWTQPIWLTLMLVPFYFVLSHEPRAIDFLTNFTGSISGSNTFDPYYFGIATGISIALIAQIGEQVDYLRFMPDKHKGNRFSWWLSMLTAGPGWIVLGFLKQIGGVLLASVVLLSGLAIVQAKEPVQMYYIAYTYVFENPELALTVSTFFVIISQIKINVTNAYAGSLAWSNFFSRVTHAHPGRVVWVVFNIGIALLLLEIGVFNAVQKVLGLYSNVAIAWISTVVADLVINKPLKLSPPIVEFKRAHLYNYNPVGFVSMTAGSVVSIIAFTGVFGLYAQAYSWLIALVISFVLSPVIAKITKGKYYIARQNIHFKNSDQLRTCGVCELEYAETDFAYCPYYKTPICSLCCTLDSSCKDQCKPPQPSLYQDAISKVLSFILKNHISIQARTRVARFILISSGILGIVATTFWLMVSVSMESSSVNTTTFYNLFFILSALICVAAWWIVLGQESQILAETELNEQNEQLEQEIKERQQAEVELKEKEERLTLATSYNGVGIWDLDLQTYELLWDDSMFKVFNIKRGDFNGVYDAWEKVLHPDDLLRARQGIQDAISGKKTFDIEFRIIWPNGEIRHIKGVAKVFRDESEKPLRMLGTNIDITAQTQAEEKLNLMAHYDPLTGLPNRTLFADRFHQAIAHSKRSKSLLAICYLDLDNFKPVNDNYGHEVGDELLIEVSARINACLREEDTISRQGGDEFSLLLGDLESVEQCEQTLMRIIQTLAQPILIDNISHQIGVSIGVTVYPDDNEDIDTLIRHADNAMYQAKQSGKHRYHFFDRKHDKQLVQRHHQLDEVQRALNNNEFCLYYQPKVNMATGEVFGAEALIRWIHPDKGLIPPLDFLPIVDGTELECQIGHWVIDNALQQLKYWLTQGINLEISVNIASHHLQSKSFVFELEAALNKYPTIKPKQLQLEILESSALGDTQTISTIIQTCQEALGVSVALDDFGTGYSSLTHLRSLTVNTIKIDQSFVRDMLDDPDDYIIIDGIIGLADSFGRDVIAEGVETTEHGLMLQIIGCKNAQGYGIAKPKPADDFQAWLSNYTPNQEWLAYGSKICTIKERKIKLFTIMAAQWKNLFIANIHSLPEDIMRWPIMDNERCSCGVWLKRENKEQLFDLKSLDLLNKTHNNIHFIAKDIQLKYLEGDVVTARRALTNFQSAFDKISNSIGLC